MPAVPSVTVISDAEKPSTASLNVIVNVISPFVALDASSVIVTIGAVSSMLYVMPSDTLVLPAASVATAVTAPPVTSTPDTLQLPFASAVAVLPLTSEPFT